MQVENDVFLFHEADRQLFCRERDGSFGKLTPSLIEKEMQFPKNPTKLHIHRLTQDGLEFLLINMQPHTRFCISTIARASRILRRWDE